MNGRRTLLEHFSEINDPRKERTKLHLLGDILVIGVVGTLCGAEGWDDIVFVANEKKEWLKTFLHLPHGIPSADTVSRVFSRINPRTFSRVFSEWISDVATLTEGEIVAIDGKTLRRSHDRTTGRSALHVVSAWACGNGVVLGQVKVDDKSNEITAIPKLLELLELKGCIVTIDAMGCQTDVAKAIIDAKADYALCVKANQGSTLEAIAERFDTGKIAEGNTLTTVDNDHGRLETRTYQVADSKRIPGLDRWPGCRSVGKVESTREFNGLKSYEIRYFIFSFVPNVTKSAKAIRTHWHIENCLHWVLDVEFDEDRNRVRKEGAPQNLNIVRHTALNLLKNEKNLKTSLGKKRLKCAMSNDYLAKVLSGAI